MISNLTFVSLIHFESIFVYGVREYTNFILLHSFTSSFPTASYWKVCLFSFGFSFWAWDFNSVIAAAAAAAKSLQSCPTLCDPRDGSPQGSPIPGILQARTLEWVAISFSIVWKRKVKVKSLSHVQLLATPCTAAYQAPPPTGFSRQEYWSGLPLSLGRN